MTELKKLTALTQEMEEIAKLLNTTTDASSSSTDTNNIIDLRKLHEKSEIFVKNSKDIHQRTDKLLSRARETDPEKQMYNENACAKIEALAVEVDRVLGTIVSEDRITEIERDFLNMLRRQAQERAAAEETAKSIDAIALEEQDFRFMLIGDEKLELSPILDWERKSKNEVYRIEGERARLKWQKEEERRAVELERAKKAHQFALEKGAKEFIVKYFVEDFIEKVKNINDEDESQSTKMKSVFWFVLQRLDEIIQALLRDPEQEGLRTMRTDGERFVKTFGHSHLFVRKNHTDSSSSSSEAVIKVEHSLLDKLTSEAAEVLLAGVGFVPTYTKSTLLDGHWIESGVGFKSDMVVVENTAKASKSVKRDEDILCFLYSKKRSEQVIEIVENNNDKTRKEDDGEDASFLPFYYRPPPWFQYGDRRLTLQEPGVAENPDVWIAWHENFKDVCEGLRKYAMQDYKKKYLAP